jgi:hypothetical protein
MPLQHLTCPRCDSGSSPNMHQTSLREPNDAPFSNQLLAGSPAALAPTRLRTRARRAWTHRPRRQAVGLVEQER